MSVSQRHPEYIEMIDEWTKARDFFHSEARVKSAGEVYLPIIGGQTDPEYESYLARASLSMLFKKTVLTYVGLSTKNSVYVDGASDTFEEYLKTCSRDSLTLDAYVQDILLKFFMTGRAGTLVDYPEGLSNDDPTLFTYPADDIINWEAKIIDGKDVLVMVVLREMVRENDSGDMFSQRMVPQYRVLYMADGVYNQALYDHGERLLSSTEPKANGKTLDYIPFVIHGKATVNPVYLSEVLDLNLHHYQVNADLLHGLHFVGLPTPWVTGVGEDEAPTFIGPTKFICLGEPDARIGLLEFTGQGLGALESKLRVFEDTISTISASIIETTGDITATQANIDFANSTATLAGTVNMLSAEFTRVLKIASEWMGESFESLQIPTDFVSGKMLPQELRELTNAYLTGAMSFETYWLNLQQGEMADPRKEAEDEQAQIEEMEPVGMATAPPENDE